MPGDLGIVNQHFSNLWRMAPQPRTVRLGGRRRSDVTIAAGDPILSREGHLVGIALSADPEFLALPVAELKELFPKTLGQREPYPVHVEIPAEATQARSNRYGLDMTKVVPVPNHKGFDSGLLIDQVQPGGPADRQGIRAGDILVGLGTWSIDNPKDSHWMMQQNPPGPLKFFVIRDGAMMYGHMTAGPPVSDRDKPGVAAPAPEERPTVHQDSRRNETALLGLILRFQPAEEQPQPGQPLKGKFLVDVVAPNSAAARAGIPIGDQLVLLGPKLITSRLVLDQVLREFHSSRIAYQLDRNGHQVLGMFRMQVEKEPTPVEASSKTLPAPKQ